LNEVVGTGPEVDVVRVFLMGISTLLASGLTVQARAETLVVTVGIDRFCEGKFLPDAKVSDVEEHVRRWAENRRIVVRYTLDDGVVEITPPSASTEYSGDDLIRELTTFLGALSTPCPAGATQIPIAVGVEGLDFAPDGTILAP
jgi:hypothetical protein